MSGLLMRTFPGTDCRRHDRVNSAIFTDRALRPRTLGTRPGARGGFEPGAVRGNSSNHFVTAAYVFVDMEKNCISYAGGGAPPLLLWRTSTGNASEVLQNGLLLGHFPNETYGVLHVPVGPGDKAVLYTDGILDANHPSEGMFGPDRFKQFLELNHHPGAERFADSLLEELSRWSGYPQGKPAARYNPVGDSLQKRSVTSCVRLQARGGAVVIGLFPDRHLSSPSRRPQSRAQS